jgi:hypothetical protein
LCVCTRQHVKSLRTLLVARVIEEIGHFFMVFEITIASIDIYFNIKHKNQLNNISIKY